MIGIAGSARRSFLFPAEFAPTWRYFNEPDNFLSLLPHISLVTAQDSGRYRLLYHSTELGIYRVRLYCDLEVQADSRRRILQVQPLTPSKPVMTTSTFTSLTSQGFYASTSVFHPLAHSTRVDYTLSLRANLTKPLGQKMVPDQVLEKIAQSIVDWRIHEIADGFIKRSVQDFERKGKSLPASN